MKRIIRKCFIYDHAPIHKSELESEHVVMASAYGSAAAINTWSSYASVAIGHVILAIYKARKAHRQQTQ